MRNRYPIFITSPLRPVVEAAPNREEPPQMDEPVRDIVVEDAPIHQEPPQIVEQELIVFDFDVAQEVEVPFEMDPAAQIMADLQIAQDIEMAELAFEMEYDKLPTVVKEPKPQRNKRSTELFRNVDFVCVRCGKKERGTDLPAEAAIGFICSVNCMTDE